MRLMRSFHHDLFTTIFSQCGRRVIAMTGIPWQFRADPYEVARSVCRNSARAADLAGLAAPKREKGKKHCEMPVVAVEGLADDVPGWPGDLQGTH
jgi:hypothetical protein